MSVQIDTAVKRARGYWFVDGFTEIATGGLFILLAGTLLLSRNASQSSFPSWFLSIASEITIVKITGILTAILILWWLKDHFTYPRTGFVRGRRITLAQVSVVIRNAVLFLVLPIVGLLMASMLTTSTGSVISSMPVWFPVGLGLVWAVLIVLAGEWMGLRRFRFLGGSILLVGIAVGIWQHAMGLPHVPAIVLAEALQPTLLESISRTLTGLSLIILITGVILMFTGMVTFLRYRKENPLPYTEDV